MGARDVNGQHPFTFLNGCKAGLIEIMPTGEGGHTELSKA